MSHDILVRIQHHPSRAELLPDLIGRLDPLRVEVVDDPRPDELASALRTYRECVSAATDATHLVVLQDDVVPCRDFAYALNAAVANHPEQIIALFVAGHPRRMAHDVRMAAQRGDPFVLIPHPDWVPTVGLVWPIEHARNFSRFLHRVPEHTWADDPIVGGFVTRYRLGVVATVPSLVQHPDLVESVLDRRPDHKHNRKKAAGRNQGRLAAVWNEGWSPVGNWPCAPSPSLV